MDPPRTEVRDRFGKMASDRAKVLALMTAGIAQ